MPYIKPPSFADQIASSAEEAKKRKAENPDPFALWRKDPTPENLLKVVESHRPTIDSATRAILGDPNDLAKRRALLMAAEAVQSFDPKKGVPLKHYIQSQLSGLRRYNRRVVEAVPVPERLRREMAILHQAKEELWGRLDREPTEEELADHTGISVRQQRKAWQRSRPTLTEGQLQQRAETGDDDAQEFLPAVTRVDPRKEIEDYVVFDLDPVDKLIYQSRTGYGGAPIRSNIEVAKMLKLSPGAVSQRAARIEQRIRELSDG